jgi:phosphoribosylformimino-5-aminoimidazole carboxamide ribonucleotide (ProFAR) isomerase
MLLIIVNLPLIKRLERTIYRESPEPVAVTGGTRQLAAASAMLWAGTIFAGRLLGYM